MDIQQMHTTFRILANQAGMQLVRGILPEHIDAYINATISEKVQIELLSGVRTVYQEEIRTQASTMSPINLFRTLYTTNRIAGVSNAALFTTNNNGYHRYTLLNSNSVMMYLGFSLEYDANSEGKATPCRLIGADVLETTLRDFCNGASKDAPIVTIGSSGVAEILDIYTGSADQKVVALNIKYIKNPAVVKFDLNENESIDCDLPAYCHYEIVEKAVQKYLISMGALTNKAQKN